MTSSTVNIVSGPWEAEWHKAEGESSDGPGYWTIDAMVMKGSPTSYGTVSDTLNRDYRISPDEDAANARLIAAAPELLEQCKKALAAWEGTGPAIPLDDVRAAIMKAEGRS